MLDKEECQFRHNRILDLNILQAHYVNFAYPRHSHDHYVIGVIERGVQSFTLKGTRHVTPASGIILINPGEVHTGEAAIKEGFHLRSLYPTVKHMEQVVFELTGRYQATPLFQEPRIDDLDISKQLLTFHRLLTDDHDPIDAESTFIETMGNLIERYGEFRLSKQVLGNERCSVQKARRFLEEHYAERIQLSDLADHVALSPYYLLRVFRAEVGLPPHAYLQDVRVRRAQRRIELGDSLADIATTVGFSSQSHLNRRFKQIVGLTPGRYASHIQP